MHGVSSKAIVHDLAEDDRWPLRLLTDLGATEPNLNMYPRVVFSQFKPGDTVVAVETEKIELFRSRATLDLSEVRSSDGYDCDESDRETSDKSIDDDSDDNEEILTAVKSTRTCEGRARWIKRQRERERPPLRPKPCRACALPTRR
ncbi:hypothetical protein AC1031_015324 [Aphanomyces cochlioides]|nr:hypothetical protein AC1031_015324 [Aphanomyces cochlioides]